MYKNVSVSFSFNHMDGFSPCHVSGCCSRFFSVGVCHIAFVVIHNLPLAPVVFVGRKGNLHVAHICVFTSTNKKMIVLTDGAAAM